MSRPLALRLSTGLAALRPLANGTAAQPAAALSIRHLSQTSTRLDTRPSRPSTESMLQSIYGGAGAGATNQDPASRSNPLDNLSSSLVFDTFKSRGGRVDTGGLAGKQAVKEDSFEPYHLHVFSHKHNTHVTFTHPNRNAIISMSCGNVGFKKTRRGTFDAAYSLAKYVMERIVYMGYSTKVNRVELSLRGFGQGREAAIKVLLSPEGAFLRDKIVRVTDATHIKHAGSRSKSKRRL